MQLTGEQREAVALNKFVWIIVRNINYTLQYLCSNGCTIYRSCKSTVLSFYVCFLQYLEGGVLLSALQGSDKSLAR